MSLPFLTPRLLKLLWVVGTAASIEIIRDIIRERRRKKIREEMQSVHIRARGPHRNEPLACRGCGIVDQTVAWTYLGPDNYSPLCFDCRRPAHAEDSA